jgi:hypothetical protein
MDRRRFVLTSLAGAFAAPLGTKAQPTGTVARVGYVNPAHEGVISSDRNAPMGLNVMRQSLRFN